MNLNEYLQHRGGNNITISEANAIGIVIQPGWPQKNGTKEVPPHLADAVIASKQLPWTKRRKLLRDLASGKKVSNVLSEIRDLLYKADEAFANDPYEAFGFVTDAIHLIEKQ